MEAMPELRRDIQTLTRWLRVFVAVTIFSIVVSGALAVFVTRASNQIGEATRRESSLMQRVDTLAGQITSIREWDEAKKKAWDARVGQLESEVRRLEKEHRLK